MNTRMPASSPAVLKIHDAAIRLFAERGAQEISISELAGAAGVARGTIYNNIPEPETLFDEVASRVLHDMHLQIGERMTHLEDPAQRLANGIRMFIRHAHEDPWWGRFVVRFARNDDTMRKLMDEPPSLDISRGIQTGRFSVAAESLPSILSLVGGATLAAMQSVLFGRQTWREAGEQIAELILRALGLDPDEAHNISIIEPPSLVQGSKSTRRSRTR